MSFHVYNIIVALSVSADRVSFVLTRQSELMISLNLINHFFKVILLYLIFLKITKFTINYNT